jgi:hypothetical protein
VPAHGVLRRDELTAKRIDLLRPRIEAVKTMTEAHSTAASGPEAWSTSLGAGATFADAKLAEKRC